MQTVFLLMMLCEGPYTFVDVAVNTWAHNAAPIQLPDGTFAIIHIGTGTGGPDGGNNCTPSIAVEAKATSNNNNDNKMSSFSKALRASSVTEAELQARLEADAMEAASSEGGSTIHIAKSLDGPWSPLQTTLGACNNPAPWVHPNGTIYVL